jgi:hypothetical protein
MVAACSNPDTSRSQLDTENYLSNDIDCVTGRVISLKALQIVVSTE